MVDENTIVRGNQLLIRREMDRRGISIKQVQLDGGWKDPSTVMSYFPNPDGKGVPQTMSVAALYRLISTKALPVDLLSLLLPSGHVIVQVPEAVDHDEISEAVCDYLREKERAHRPDSECGPAIGPNEDASLRDKFAVVAGGRA
jgi:hypothetical protein